MNTLLAPLADAGVRFDHEVLHATRELFRPLIAATPDVAVTSDVPYGTHPRQALDLFRRAGAEKSPVVLYVPGGGFSGGDKRQDDVFLGNVGRYFASHGALALVMNYRLAPEFVWPSGAEDVRRAVAWAKENAGAHGGDPERIFVVAQSAGANHAATALFNRDLGPELPLAGAFLISGVYEITPEYTFPGMVAYFGATPEQQQGKSCAHLVGDSKVPVALAYAEYDPPLFAFPTLTLGHLLALRDGKVPPVLWLEGHNHVSTVFSFGSPEDTLGRAVREFMARHPGA